MHATNEQHEVFYRHQSYLLEISLCTNPDVNMTQLHKQLSENKLEISS